MTMFLTIAVVVLIFIVIFQISKASEYVSVINGNDTARKQSNKINGFLMLGFMIFGLIGVWYCNELLYHKTLMAQPAASNHGEKVDEMLKLTIDYWYCFYYNTSIVILVFI
jgi:cytochrome c oxidase subunit 2